MKIKFVGGEEEISEKGEIEVIFKKYVLFFVFYLKLFVVFVVVKVYLDYVVWFYLKYLLI